MQCLKEIGARTLYPLSRLGACCAGGNVPSGREAAEVIQPNRIYVGEQGTYSIDRPAITRRTQRVPVVNRIPPQLSLRAEIVRRNACQEARPAILIKQEQFGVSPDITGIRRYKEWQIADESHALGMCKVLELISLAKQQKLRKPDLVDLIC